VQCAHRQPRKHVLSGSEQGGEQKHLSIFAKATFKGSSGASCCDLTEFNAAKRVSKVFFFIARIS
jgi:hypothetical protein